MSIVKWLRISFMMIAKQKLPFAYVATLFCFLIFGVNNSFAQNKLDENGNENFVNTAAKDTSLAVLLTEEKAPIAIERISTSMCCLRIPAKTTASVNTRYIIAREFTLNPVTNDLIVPMPKQ
jgi:hypothetical protein